MQKINSNLLQKIHARLEKDPNFLVWARLEVAKGIFIAVTSVYFLAFLFSARKFQLEGIDTLLYITYPIFVFSTFFLLHQLVIYGAHIYAPSKKWIPTASLAILGIIFALLFALHLGFIR